ncbi:helix-turn-helix transcriptional regulator [Arcanobacterium hippocoleae]|uniref:ArsR family transcriptional regulator n=1 Tax=Arcanobacterium hippocoleae TaxID=149017 RepID=A0ABU1T183_9ACTO|nr:winged helix-turn-helix transcriptional regulator [Arcanobacterium hippocoleae]MDR6938610.1 putative ArsR family transcriptional regulator [Arcanobacterium hippocoleae]
MDRNDLGTCEQILRLIVERGPITSGELARILVLTPAAVRRHITTLIEDEYIQLYETPSHLPLKRGRPSRRYVATNHGHAQLNEAYADIATHALAFVRENLGDSGIDEFAQRRTKTLESRYQGIVDAAGPHPADKVAALGQALDRDGFMTTLRRGGPHGISLQLCQGHCPVQDVAGAFPELCEAETRAFAKLLGVPIQRLSTLASGGHVCTTNIPIVNTHKIPNHHNRRSQ